MWCVCVVCEGAHICPCVCILICRGQRPMLDLKLPSPLALRKESVIETTDHQFE